MMQSNDIPEFNQRLGVVISGALTKGLEVKLDSCASVEDMAVGRYVTIKGQKSRYFGMITDVTLGVVDEQINVTPSDASDPFLSEVLAGTSTFGTLHVLPMLNIGNVAGLEEGPKPVKTVPTHFSAVEVASQRDVEIVFGGEDERKFFIGTPLDMETKICLDLPEFVKRSNGIFGKSGTGKTFLTRMLLVGMLQKSSAVNLVFDMHNEYGWEGTSETTNYKVKALKQLFPSKVAVFTLDEESSRRRKVSTDAVVRLGYEDIDPEDIGLLRQTLNLTENAVQATYQLARRYGDKNWMKKTLDMENDENSKKLLSDLNIHEATFANLRRGLESITRLPFLTPNSQENPVDKILKYLDKGVNVVLEFGRFTDLKAYMLVANMLSRRIYNRYRDMTEKALGEDTAKPRSLVITIEEAHKFLNPEVANQTIFGTIAREMRKYNVTLLVIDQRPSGIDEEVMSQIGTKITCLLDNEKDIDAVLTGVSGKNELRAVLARLEPKQQSLIFGHAVPMPVVVRTREYGTKFIEEVSHQSTVNAKQVEKDIEDLWG